MEATNDGFADGNDVVNMRAVCCKINNSNGLSSSVSEDQRSCADELLQRLSSDGFAYVRGTGISAELCEEALLLTKAFLADADETVRRSCLTQDRARRGYSPMCTENFASLIGQEEPNDLVRKFRMGPTAREGHDDEAGDKFSSLLQPNIWPSEETWDKELASSFQSTIERYYQEACEAANHIVVAISDAIRRKQPDLSRAMEVFSANSETPAHTSILTLLGYKVGARHKSKNRSPLVAAHTDVGVITMLLFDGPGCAQLQRSDKGQGGWVPVRLPYAVPDDPIFVINIGDCMSELTSNILPSTLHRVVADPKCKDPRHCLALFMGLDPRALLTIDNEAMSYEEWRKRRIARAQEVLRAGKEL
jgi:isopenicillin N synthase-like dioxygenase